MQEDIAVGIAAIVFVGVGAQWLAGWLRLPSVLVLLPAGVLAGPATGLVKPDEIFGEALFPVISIAVGLILFEGGTSLRLDGAGTLRRPITGLVTVGLAVTWAVGGAAATILLEVRWTVGFLLGAILVVSGPTVVLPLLDAVRLREPVEPILRWECIVIDPIGAVLAVAVFEAVRDAEKGFNAFTVLASSAAVGIATGLIGGFGLALVLRRHLVPDRLHNPLTLAVAVGSFVLANQLSVEAGLFATTVLGVVLVNQHLTPVGHIAAFGEDVGVLLLGSLFVVLGATVEFDAIRRVALPALGLLVVLLAVRPVAVWLATLGSGLRRRERLYVALIAPRGVVAASVAALFGVSLAAEGTPGAQLLAPTAFIVIIGSVTCASLLARPAARWLQVAEAPRRGVLLVGDDPWLIDLAAELARHEVPVMVVPVEGDGAEASARDLLTYHGPLESDELGEAIDGSGMSQVVIAVGKGDTELFLLERLSGLLGRRQVYRVERPEKPNRSERSRAWGRRAFPGIRGVQGSAAPAEGDEPRWSVTTVGAGDPLGDGVVPLVHLHDDGSPEVRDVRRGRDRHPDDGRLIVAVPEG